MFQDRTAEPLVRPRPALKPVLESVGATAKVFTKYEVRVVKREGERSEFCLIYRRGKAIRGHYYTCVKKVLHEKLILHVTDLQWAKGRFPTAVAFASRISQHPTVNFSQVIRLRNKLPLVPLNRLLRTNRSFLLCQTQAISLLCLW